MGVLVTDQPRVIIHHFAWPGRPSRRANARHELAAQLFPPLRQTDRQSTALAGADDVLVGSIYTLV